VRRETTEGKQKKNEVALRQFVWKVGLEFQFVTEPKWPQKGGRLGREPLLDSKEDQRTGGNAQSAWRQCGGEGEGENATGTQGGGLLGQEKIA